MKEHYFKHDTQRLQQLYSKTLHYITRDPLKHHATGHPPQTSCMSQDLPKMTITLKTHACIMQPVSAQKSVKMHHILGCMSIYKLYFKPHTCPKGVQLGLHLHKLLVNDAVNILVISLWTLCDGYTPQTSCTSQEMNIFGLHSHVNHIMQPKPHA